MHQLELLLLLCQQGAMVLLEKSLLEKQETVTSLRKQLEELKDLNLKMQNQLKVRPVVGVAWHGCGMAWVWHGMGVAWHGCGMAWVWHGMGVAWHGCGMDVVWHGCGMGVAWVWHGMGVAWHGCGMAWVWHGAT